MNVRRLRKELVLLLSCAAGAVDAATYIGLGHVFTANMTGNSVHLGMALGHMNALDVGRAGSALVGFLSGVAVGAAIVERDDSPALWPHAVTIALSVELLLLVAITFTWWIVGVSSTVVADALLIALGGAMGVQSVAVNRLRIPGVVSTYLTGTLTTLVTGLARRAWGKTRPTPEASTHGALLLSFVWIIYVTGAAVTTLASPAGGPLSLLLPIVLVAIVLAGADRRAEPRSP